MLHVCSVYTLYVLCETVISSPDNYNNNLNLENLVDKFILNRRSRWASFIMSNMVSISLHARMNSCIDYNCACIGQLQLKQPPNHVQWMPEWSCAADPFPCRSCVRICSRAGQLHEQVLHYYPPNKLKCMSSIGITTSFPIPYIKSFTIKLLLTKLFPWARDRLPKKFIAYVTTLSTSVH